MIAAYIPTFQTWYFPDKQIYDENFVIYGYVTQKYRYVGCFGTVEDVPVDVYADLYETKDDSRLLLIAALQYRGKSKAEIKRVTSDIDKLKVGA